jgi:hypothetical protein
MIISVYCKNNNGRNHVISMRLKLQEDNLQLLRKCPTDELQMMLLRSVDDLVFNFFLTFIQDSTQSVRVVF